MVSNFINISNDTTSYGSKFSTIVNNQRRRQKLRSENMQLVSMSPPSAISSISTAQVFQRKRTKILGEYEPLANWRKEDLKLLKFFAPPFMAVAIALSPICHPPVSVGQTIDAPKGATLFHRACIGCHDAGGNIIQPGATLLLKDLERNGVDTEDEIYRITYNGKGRMPGFGENCTPRGQCTFGPRLQEDEIKLLAQFVKSQADQGWPSIETEGD